MSVPSLGILGLGHLQGMLVPHYAHGAMVVAVGMGREQEERSEHGAYNQLSLV